MLFNQCDSNLALLLLAAPLASTKYDLSVSSTFFSTRRFHFLFEVMATRAPDIGTNFDAISMLFMFLFWLFDCVSFSDHWTWLNEEQIFAFGESILQHIVCMLINFLLGRVLFFKLMCPTVTILANEWLHSIDLCQRAESVSDVDVVGFDLLSYGSSTHTRSAVLRKQYLTSMNIPGYRYCSIPLRTTNETDRLPHCNFLFSFHIVRQPMRQDEWHNMSQRQVEMVQVFRH